MLTAELKLVVGQVAERHELKRLEKLGVIKKAEMTEPWRIVFVCCKACENREKEACDDSGTGLSIWLRRARLCAREQHSARRCFCSSNKQKHCENSSLRDGSWFVARRYNLVQF